MKAVIYDYANTPVEVELPDKPITSIFVRVISGDEVVSFVFADGSSVDADSSDSRIMGFDDGCYVVTGDDIQKWLDFKPSDGRTFSYCRQDEF